MGTVIMESFVREFWRIDKLFLARVIVRFPRLEQLRAIKPVRTYSHVRLAVDNLDDVASAIDEFCTGQNRPVRIGNVVLVLNLIAVAVGSCEAEVDAIHLGVYSCHVWCRSAEDF